MICTQPSAGDEKMIDDDDTPKLLENESLYFLKALAKVAEDLNPEMSFSRNAQVNGIVYILHDKLYLRRC